MNFQNTYLNSFIPSFLHSFIPSAPVPFRLDAAEHLLGLLELAGDRLGDAVVPVEVVVIAEVRLDGLQVQYTSDSVNLKCAIRYVNTFL